MEGGESEGAQIAAANALLDRGWGRPTQPVAGDEDLPALKHAHAIIPRDLSGLTDDELARLYREAVGSTK